MQESKKLNIRGNANPSHPATHAILLVDDNEMVIDVAHDILEMQGYQVVSTYLPSIALKLVEQKKISVDLLVTDVVMPQMNGPEMYQLMKRMIPDLPVLYMSGYSDQAIQGVLPDGCVEFIYKPFNDSSLLNSVAKILKNTE